MQNIETSVLRLISNNFRRAEATLESSFLKDLAFDSLTFVELLMVCESEFNLEFSSAEAKDIQSVRSLIELISQKLASQTVH